MSKQAKAGPGGLDMDSGSGMGVERYLRVEVPLEMARGRQLLRGELVQVHALITTPHGFHQAHVMAADGTWAWVYAEDLAETQEAV